MTWFVNGVGHDAATSRALENTHIPLAKNPFGMLTGTFDQAGLVGPRPWTGFPVSDVLVGRDWLAPLIPVTLKGFSRVIYLSGHQGVIVDRGLVHCDGCLRIAWRLGPGAQFWPKKPMPERSDAIPCY